MEGIIIIMLYTLKEPTQMVLHFQSALWSLLQRCDVLQDHLVSWGWRLRKRAKDKVSVEKVSLLWEWIPFPSPRFLSIALWGFLHNSWCTVSQSHSFIIVVQTSVCFQCSFQVTLHLSPSLKQSSKSGSFLLEFSYSLCINITKDFSRY